MTAKTGFLNAAVLTCCCLAAAIAPANLVQNSAFAAAQCWSEEELAGRPGEKAIWRTPYNRAIEPRGTFTELPPVPPQMRGSIRSVKLREGERLVALTFDLCENPGEISGYDAGIVDTLRREDVKATFFASGKWLLDHEERAQQLLGDRLFQVGLHSWTHRNFRLLNDEQVRADLALDLRADAEVRKKLASRACFRPAFLNDRQADIRLFRFPFGACNEESLNAVNNAGLLAIQWDVVSGDPSAQTAEAIRQSVVASAKPGSIIVMHANGRGKHTAEALPLIISDLRRRGFSFATVGELLERGEAVIAKSCYERKPGDNVKYDRLFPVKDHRPPRAFLNSGDGSAPGQAGERR
ncbi:MAG TPA: polysaccharide deacetylase family protein [Hyphomicrobiales bacterium]|nr:polysaccharide deacetylase family protein [Hyphomicrobiales bacterium]